MEARPRSAMSSLPHPFSPEPDPHQKLPWEPEAERQMDARQQRDAQAHEADHGRHDDDRSRPASFVRKSR